MDIILIETISRLNILQFDKIDDLQLLPRPILGVGDEVGILERWHFRWALSRLHRPSFLIVC